MTTPRTARRFARHGDGPHACPDAYVPFGGEPHALIRDRNAAGVVIPDRWVCPIDLNVEMSEAHEAAEKECEAKERQERAEKIADDIMTARMGAGRSPSIRKMLAAAALAGLTEKENAR